MKLVALAVACFVTAVSFTLFALGYMVHRAGVERSLLLEFVCASVHVREQADVPEAEAWRRLVDEILARHGEHGRCDSGP